MHGLTLTSVTGWHQAYVKSETDYWWGSPDKGFTDSAGAPQTRTFLFPGSNLGGQYGSETVFDRSQSTDKMFTQELRVVSAFDGMFNFQAGAIYNNGTVDALYNVWGGSLEAFWTSLEGMLPNPIAHDSTCKTQERAERFRRQWRARARGRRDPALLADLLRTWQSKPSVVQNRWPTKAIASWRMQARS